MKPAIFWAHMGPYHFARFSAFQRRIETARLVELADNNSTYGWMRKTEGVVNFDSLFHGVIAESVSILKTCFALYSYLRVHSIDVLFVPSFWPAYTLVAALIARVTGCRVVFMTESHEGSGDNKGLKLLVKRLLIKIYSSALVGGVLHHSYVMSLGLPKHKIFDGYDVVNNKFFELEAARSNADAIMIRERLQLPHKFFLSLGRFVEKKDLTTLLIAYADLVTHGDNADHSLVFVGAGPMKARLLELASELKLNVIDHETSGVSEIWTKRSESVYFIPFAQIDIVPAFYALATAFVLASTTEEWGLVINEAMASGCPTLVSSVVGCAPDLVDDGKTGYLFDPGDVATLSDRMARMCNDPEHARALGCAAQQKIADWSCDRFARNAFLAAQAALGDNAVFKEII